METDEVLPLTDYKRLMFLWYPHKLSRVLRQGMLASLIDKLTARL